MFLKFPQIKEGGPNFFPGTSSAESMKDLVPPSLFQYEKFEGFKFLVIH